MILSWHYKRYLAAMKRSLLKRNSVDEVDDILTNRGEVLSSDREMRAVNHVFGFRLTLSIVAVIILSIAS